MENSEFILEARGLFCSRATAAGPLASIRDVSLPIREGTVNLLAGDSRGGENLLLRLLGLLEPPDSGEILFRGNAASGLSEEDRAELRNRRYGFLFSEPFLLPSFSVVENIAMPLFKISAVGPDEARKRTEALLEFAGIENIGNCLIGRLPHALQQRVSLARALVNRPEILVVENADAGLDGEESPAFLELVRRANTEFGTTIILAVGERAVLKFPCRVVELAGGVIVRDSQNVVESGGALS